jgi:hypothetical protein
MVLLFLVVLAFAKVVGPISPTFPEAGRQWASAARRFGPTALVGYVLGWIIWPLRVDTYSMFWMPILGALIALMVRNVYLQIRGGHQAAAPEPPPDAPKIAANIPTPAEVN